MTWPTNSPIARELNDFWSESQSLFQQWWYEADLDTRMFTGQQDYSNNGYANNYRNQKQLQFNKILRIINMIGGYQRDNRLATIVSPADNDKDAGATADQLTKVLSWVMRQDQTYEKISDCFDGSNVCGLNLLHVWMDFREDPENGDIKTDRLPFSSFLMDPYWTKPDLSDCGRIWTRKYVTKKQLKSLIPDIDDKDIASLGKGYSAKDGKFQFMSQNWYQYQQQLYAYDEYWTKDYKTGRKILDTNTGEVVDWRGTKDQFQLIKMINPNIKMIKAEIPTIKWHVLVNNNLMYEEKTPYGIDRFPFVPFTCYHYPEVQNYGWRYQGIVRNVRDSQIELNKRRNRLLDIMDAQVQSGLMVKEDALVNPEDAFLQGPGRVLFFKQTSNLGSDVAPIPPPPVAQGWMELIQTIEKEIMDIVGPEELFAQNMGAKEMSGVLMKLKMGAGLTGLRNIFDKLNQSQMYVGEIMQDLMQANFSKGKVRNITGEDPSEEWGEFWQRKYHCVTEEAELTTSQRQLQFLQGMQMKQMGMMIPDSYLLDKSTLTGKKDLMEAIKAQEEQQSKMQQMQVMQQMQQQELVNRSIEAKAQNDFAAARERDARSVADIALAKENTSQAVHHRASAALDNARALKELDGMDEERLMKLASFVLDMQERQKALQGGEEEDSVAVSQNVGAKPDKSEGISQTTEMKNKEMQQMQQSMQPEMQNV